MKTMHLVIMDTADLCSRRPQLICVPEGLGLSAKIMSLTLK